MITTLHTDKEPLYLKFKMVGYIQFMGFIKSGCVSKHLNQGKIPLNEPLLFTYSEIIHALSHMYSFHPALAS